MKTNKKLTKKLIVAIFIIILLLGATYHFGPKAFQLYILSRNISKKLTPNSYLTPTYRVISPTNLNHLKSVNISTAIFKLKVPWTIKRKFSTDEETIFIFHEKKLLTIRNKLRKGKIIDEILTDNPDDAKNIKELIGEEHFHSDFTFIRLCLNTTPDQASLFMSNMMLGRISTILIMRAIYEPLGANIFEFNLYNGLKGFQFGEFGEKKMVTIHLLDNTKSISV